MLEACGFGAEQALAAVIGTDGLFEAPVLAWADLAEPQVRTFSRSPEGWRLRSLLERYDYEHSFRIKIAAVAQQQTGRPEQDPELLVRPIVNKECPAASGGSTASPSSTPMMSACALTRAPWTCEKSRRCGATALRRSPTLRLPTLISCWSGTCPRSPIEREPKAGSEWPLGGRECCWKAPRLIGRPPDRSRCRRPRSRSIWTLRARRMVEFYLWGFLVRQAGEEAVYHEFSRFDDLDDRSEAALAADAFTWLRSVVESRPSVAVFHYSGYEVAKISELAARQQGEHDELFDWAAGYAEEHFVDLEIVKAHYFGVSGLGLKLMARHVGFSWRDDDPGGLNSQLWFADAVHGDTAEVRAAARRRVLEYNEDDVIATSQVRAWLRAQ